MKNIHILQTDKPSRLVKQKYDTIDRLCLADMATKRAEYKKFNIYITSDEEIKIGTWAMSLCNDEFYEEIYQCKKANLVPIEDRKIILTTDQDLIKDGVQAIDDKFLEWFVKNPSCKKVEVEKAEHGMYKDDVYYKLSDKIFYKIIIPKECMITKIMQMDAKMAYDSLPKQETLSGFEEGHKANLDWLKQNSNQTKQETLEEAAEIFVKNRFTKQICNDESYPDIYASKAAIVESHILFAKWQMERSYSEEEVMDMFHNLSMHLPLHYEFLVNEQFKKK